MTEQVVNAQKKNPAHAMLEWVRRVHLWLMTEEEEKPAASQVERPPEDAPAVKPPRQRALDEGHFLERHSLLQIMWGEGWHVPIGDHMTSVMVRSFGLDNTMTVLDLTAGLGGAGRQIVNNYGSYVTGLEADAALISPGRRILQQHGQHKHVSLDAYDPGDFKATKRYDGIIGRELCFRIKNKKEFAGQIVGSLKDRAHFSWTDLVRDDATPMNPVLEQWQAFDAGGAALLTASDAGKLWNIQGLEVRVSEDRTGHYADAITEGLANLMQTLEETPLAPAARAPVLQEVQLWATRMAALSSGLRFYRFYANKK